MKLINKEQVVVKVLKRATHISRKCDEVGFGGIDEDVVVQFLFKHHLPLLWKNKHTISNEKLERLPSS